MMADRRPRSVRKRSTTGTGILSHGGTSYLPSTSTSLYGSTGSKTRTLNPLQRVRNTLSTLLVMSFPLGIFLLPYLLSSKNQARQQHRIVVALTTVPERLPLLRPLLESVLRDQTVPPDVVYLILPTKDYYTKDELVFEQPWPLYVDELLESTTLEILQPEFAYGPFITSLLYALETEEGLAVDISNAKDAASNPIPASSSESSGGLSTRIIAIHDTFLYSTNLIQLLVDGSSDHPESLVALSGTKLRSDFRQVRFYWPPEFDKSPNLYVTTEGDGGDLGIDIVQGSMGLCLSSSTVDHNQLLTLAQDESLPRTVVKTDGILLSAMMEVLNVTRVLVPGGSRQVQYLSNSTSLSHEMASEGIQMEWMEATYYLQQKWNVWSDYHLLDPDSFTQAQKDAMHCEAAHTPDCTSQPDVCLPVSSDCPTAEIVLSELVVAPENDQYDPS